MTQRVLIISHDAGGAEIVSSLALERADCDYQFFLDGPAEKIFSRKGLYSSDLALEEAIAQADWILCGTSWESDLELRAIQSARSLGKKSVAFLDHWVNFKERFERDTVKTLPDEIWVGDEEAFEIAKSAFPRTSVKFRANPYYAAVQSKIITKANPEREVPGRLLYLAEPISEHAEKQMGDPMVWGYDEFSALSFMLKNSERFPYRIVEIIIRQHPSEPAGKYDFAFEQTVIPIQYSSRGDLVDDILDAQIVAGCETMAMVVGLLAEKQVYSIIPPGGRPCVLPNKNIKNFAALCNELVAK